MNVPAYKIGSGECNNYPLLKHIACVRQADDPQHRDEHDRERAAKPSRFSRRAACRYALMHTTNLYPTPPHLVRLGAMVELRQAFPNAVIGLSDHTTDNVACLGAVALGASILERHFTDHMFRPGPDIVCSMDEKACRELIASSDKLHTELGGTKGPAKEEQVTMDFAFATVVTIAPIQSGRVAEQGQPLGEAARNRTYPPNTTSRCWGTGRSRFTCRRPSLAERLFLNSNPAMIRKFTTRNKRPEGNESVGHGIAAS